MNVGTVCRRIVVDERDGLIGKPVMLPKPVDYALPNRSRTNDDNATNPDTTFQE